VTPPENDRQSADDADLARAVMQCRQADSFLQAILDIYEDIDRADKSQGPVCMGGGACCRFDLFDHRLYVTLGELALLSRTGPNDPSRTARNRCPYQQGPRCHARTNRPLGCRVFFCREDSDTPDNDAYEAAHKRICELHAKHDLPYAYVELISALKILRKFAVDTG
jgi:Fe-S-cluster containining protein